jgi:hypothetical protein
LVGMEQKQERVRIAGTSLRQRKEDHIDSD